MHDTHVGFHAPPHFNQLPTATPEKDFHHIKKVVTQDGKTIKTLTVVEKGVALNTDEFQKYCGKKAACPGPGYNYADHPFDPFLSSLGVRRKQLFDLWSKMHKNRDPSKVGQNMPKNWWYMIIQDGGFKKVGLYQDYDVFKSILNEGAVYQADGRNCGLKGVWFKDLAAAEGRGALFRLRSAGALGR